MVEDFIWVELHASASNVPFPLSPEKGAAVGSGKSKAKPVPRASIPSCTRDQYIQSRFSALIHCVEPTWPWSLDDRDLHG